MKPNTVIVGWPYSWRKDGVQSWKIFIQTVRTVAACHMALLVPKGINFFPESNHKVSTSEGGGGCFPILLNSVSLSLSLSSP